MNKESYYFKKRASKQEAFCDRDVFLGSFPEMKYDNCSTLKAIIEKADGRSDINNR